MGDTCLLKSHACGLAQGNALEFALVRLFAKLKSSQPPFTDEDAAVLPSPVENDNSATCLASTANEHRKLHSTDDGTVSEANFSRNVKLNVSISDQTTKHLLKLSSSSCQPNFVHISKVKMASGGIMNVDSPLSVSLFIAAVNAFEPTLIRKSRKAALESVKLIEQGFLLAYQATQTQLPREGKDLAHFRRPAPAPVLAAEGVPLSHGVSPRSATHETANLPPCRCSWQSLDSALILYLDQSIQTLLVYCNVSTALTQYLTSTQSVLRFFSFVCSLARLIQEGVDSSKGTYCRRDLDAELGRLNSFWNSCGLVGRTVTSLQECYLIEFLLDAALPPAVCSSRYEGLINALHEKKHRITFDILINRENFRNVLRRAPLRGIVGFIKMSAFAGEKQHARLLDRVILEGLTERLAQELKAVSKDLTLLPTSENDIANPRMRPLGVLENTPVKMSIHNAANDTSCSLQEKRFETSRVAEIKARNGSACVSRAIENLGYCVDILLAITGFNPYPMLESDEMAKAPTRTTPAAGRLALWVTQETILRETLVLLLYLACYRLEGENQRLLGLLQPYIAGSVLQIAVHSNRSYHFVIDAVDTLLGNSSSATSSRSGSWLCHGTIRPNLAQSPDPTTSHELDALKYLQHLTPLLPLLVGLLGQKSSLRTHETSICRWFKRLCDNLFPDAFEVPSLISRRRSTNAWGRLLTKPGVQTSTGLPASDTRSSTATALARDLRRPEAVCLLPYFTFACRVIRETDWRKEMATFFTKIASLSYHVMMTNLRQRNLFFNQAFCCYDLVSRTLVEYDEAVLEETRVDAGDQTPNQVRSTQSTEPLKNRLNDSSEVKKRSRSAGTIKDEVPEPFIPSPSQGLAFYEAFTSHSTDTESKIGSKNNSTSIRHSNHEYSGAFSKGEDTLQHDVCDRAGLSPQGVLTRPWYLARRMLFSTDNHPNISHEGA